MKKILLPALAAALLTLSSCAANPNKSYSNSTTVVGFEFSVNPETLFPFLRLGYITNDYANVTKEASYEARREYAGSADSGVENASPWALNKWIKITRTDSRRN